MLTTLLLGLALTPSPTDSIELRTVLAIERLGERRRSAVFTDALEQELVLGRWAPPKEGDSMLSIPASDEEAQTHTWRTVVADDEGWLSGPEFRGGWAYAEVEIPEAGPWLLDAIGHSLVYIDGEPRYGDVYQLGITKTPAWLEAGVHELLFRGGRGRLKATLHPAPAKVFLALEDQTLPDVLRDGSTDWIAGLIVSNAGALAVTEYTIVTRAKGCEGTSTPVPTLLPSSYRKCAVNLSLPANPTAEELEVTIELRDSSDRVVHTLDCKLDVRDPLETHSRTFVSEIDGSVQYFGVTPPLPAGDSGAPDLILTLHGASVEGRRQARGYSPKDGAVVVAPTNRRPFGFDWEDWGRLDALEVLSRAEALYGTNPRRTYLTGHSMGGHGTWQLGVHFPDRFAAIGPSAGWSDFWSYSGSPLTLDADPVGQVLDRASNASRTLLLKENLLQSGVYVLHGDADETVPVREARAMREILAESHPNFAYYERPGAGHWWGDECMDWPPLIQFLRENEIPESRSVHDLAFTTIDPGVAHECHWISVVRQTAPLEPSRVRARLDEDQDRIEFELENVESLRLDLEVLATGDDSPLDAAGKVRLVLGDKELTLEANGRWYLSRVEDGWHVARSDDPALKNPARNGGFKSAFRHRMLFVYGTQGNPEENRWAETKARFDHETWRYRGNGAVEITRDVDFDAASAKDRGVILYGNADTNAAWSSVLETPPFELRRGLLRIGERSFEGSDLALLAVYPRKGSDIASVAVIGGTGLEGARVTNDLPYFVSGVGYPDWTVIGAELPGQGAAGIRGAGWFDSEWSVVDGQNAAWR